MVSRSQWSSILRLCWVLSAQNSTCLMFACFSCGESIWIFCGWRITRVASCWMRGAKVALNIIVCLRSMVKLVDFGQVVGKAESSMRSASSTTEEAHLVELDLHRALQVEQAAQAWRPRGWRSAAWRSAAGRGLPPTTLATREAAAMLDQVDGVVRYLLGGFARRAQDQGAGCGGLEVAVAGRVLALGASWAALRRRR